MDEAMHQQTRRYFIIITLLNIVIIISYIGTYNDLNENSGQTSTGCVYNIKFHVFTFFGSRRPFVPTPIPPISKYCKRSGDDAIPFSVRPFIHLSCVHVCVYKYYSIMI